MLDSFSCSQCMSNYSQFSELQLSHALINEELEFFIGPIFVLINWSFLRTFFSLFVQYIKKLSNIVVVNENQRECYKSIGMGGSICEPHFCDLCHTVCCWKIFARITNRQAYHRIWIHTIKLEIFCCSFKSFACLSIISSLICSF